MHCFCPSTSFVTSHTLAQRCSSRHARHLVASATLSVAEVFCQCHVFRTPQFCKPLDRRAKCNCVLLLFSVREFQLQWNGTLHTPMQSHVSIRKFHHFMSGEMVSEPHSRHFTPYRAQGHKTCNELHSIENCESKSYNNRTRTIIACPCGSANTNDP